MAQLKITLVRSSTGYEKSQGLTARALGLRRLHQTVIQPDNDAIRGMVFKISHLLKVEPVEESAAAAGETATK